MNDPNRQSNIARGFFVIVTIVVTIVVCIMVLANSGGSDEEITWQQYDVTITVNEDGSLHVVESQDVRFEGRFSQGYAVIPLERIGSIDNVRITVDGQRSQQLTGDTTSIGVPTSLGRPGSDEFIVTETEDEFRVDYGFSHTGPSMFEDSGSTSFLDDDDDYSSFFDDEEDEVSASEREPTPTNRKIVLEYDVTGAIRDYPDAEEPWQQLHWMAISDEVTDVADIDNATVTIILPESVDAGQLSFAPEPDEVSANRLVWTQSSMSEGDQFDAQVAFPVITSATAPDWQPEADRADAAAEDQRNRTALANVLLTGSGILVAVIGGLGLLYAWYSRVRESVPGVVHDQLTEPPGDLPAGLVGTLVDEIVHPRDVAAMLLDLSQRGVIGIHPAGEKARSRRFGATSAYDMELAQPIAGAEPWERPLLKAIFRNGPVGSVESFARLTSVFQYNREEIQHAMEAELVNRGLMVERPETSRKNWLRTLKVFLGISVVIPAVIWIWNGSWTWFAVAPTIAGIAVYYLGKRMLPSIPLKTSEGADVSARWKAFERYLATQGGGILSRRKDDISEKYLPWIVAFGLDSYWIRQMNTPGTVQRSASSPGRPRLPTSHRPVNASTGSGSGTGSRWITPAPPMDLPDWNPDAWGGLQGASDTVMSRLGSGSQSMFRMLGDAMAAMGKNRGGGSSGGGSFGGGFGGSSGSGGGSVSSSGGGSRGFS